MKKLWIITIIFIILQACTEGPPSSPVKSGSFGKIRVSVLQQKEDGSYDIIMDVKVWTEPETKEISVTTFNEIENVPVGEYIVFGEKEGYTIEPKVIKVVGGYATNVTLVARKKDQSDTNNRPPEPPYNPHPEDKAKINTTAVELTWQCKDPDGDKLFFDVYLAEAGGKREKIAEKISDNFFEIRDLIPGKTYFWNVLANDGKGGISISKTWQFTVVADGNMPPQPPYDPDPANRSEINITEYTFTWKCEDPDGDELYYDFYLGRTDGELIKIAEKLKTRNFFFANLQPGTAYNWRVVATDIHGAKSESDIWTFKVMIENKPPVSPFSPNPSDNSIVTKSDYNLTWQCYDPDGDPLTYDVLMSKGNGMLEPVAVGIEAREFHITGLDNNSTYTWKVIAKDGKGGIAESKVWTFFTKFNTGGLLKDLLAFYPFDGNAKDDGPNHYDGQISGAKPAKDRFNRSGKALFFGRGQEVVELPEAAAFDFKKDFTIACWVKPNLDFCIPYNKTHIEIISKTGLRGIRWALGFTTNLGTEFWINNEFIGYDYIKLKNNAWNHITIVFRRSRLNNNGFASLYLNGTLLGQSKILPTPESIGNNVRIGDRPDASSFGGSLDDIYFFNRALLENEIRELMMRRTD
jgi:hypothetical protein